MTNDELLKIVKAGGQVPVPYFDGAELNVSLDPTVPAEEAAVALQTFLTLTNDMRLADGRHLVAYCQLLIAEVGKEEILKEIGGNEPAAETIWDHVGAKQILFGKLEAGKYASKPTVYVQIKADVAWELDFGLQMSWADGARLVKVGPFDGYPTNGYAYADPEKDQFVFHCFNPNLCTTPDSA